MNLNVKILDFPSAVHHTDFCYQCYEKDGNKFGVTGISSMNVHITVLWQVDAVGSGKMAHNVGFDVARERHRAQTEVPNSAMTRNE